MAAVYSNGVIYLSVAGITPNITLHYDTLIENIKGKIIFLKKIKN